MNSLSCESCTGNRKSLCELAVRVQVDTFSVASVVTADMIEWTTSKDSILEPYSSKIIDDHMNSNRDLRDRVLENVSRDLGEIGCGLAAGEIEQKFEDELLQKINES